MGSCSSKSTVSDSSQFKLTYFDAQGRGEICRLMFVMAGRPFNDVRVQQSEWPELKPTTPYGTLPTLEAGGMTLADSAAIARFLAKEFGLSGKNTLEEAQVDMITCICTDAYTPLIKVLFEKDEKKKEAAAAKYKENEYARFTSFIEKQLNGKDWLVGNKPTLADAMAVQVATNFISAALGAETVKSNTTLAGLIKRFEGLPKVAAYIESRPKTAF